MGIRTLDGWFLTDTRATSAATPVYCFAHAGGHPSSFLRWQDQLGQAVRMLAVVPPGRGHRSGTDFVTSIDEYAEKAAQAILARADRRLVLFGHSLGALIAFEVARRLRGQALVTDLVASACAAPSLLPSARVVAIAQLDGQAFAQSAAFFGGLPPEVIDDEEVRELFLPPLQQDLRLVAAYRYRSAPPLTCRMHLVNGTDDTHVNGDALAAWAEECQQVPQRIDVPGGHFYFEQDPTVLTRLLHDLATRESVALGKSPGRHEELI